MGIGYYQRELVLPTSHEHEPEAEHGEIDITVVYPFPSGADTSANTGIRMTIMAKSIPAGRNPAYQVSPFGEGEVLDRRCTRRALRQPISEVVVKDDMLSSGGSIIKTYDRIKSSSRLSDGAASL